MAVPPVSNDDFGTRHGRDATGRGGRTATSSSTSYGTTSGLAFLLRSARGERFAGLAVVFAIFASACVALVQTILRFIHPHALSHLWWLAAAGVIGFLGNEIAAQIRTRAGKRLNSPALVADGNHARVDGFVSLGVIASAAVVALGFPVADPVIGLIITLVILHITWESWQTVRTTQVRTTHP